MFWWVLLAFAVAALVLPVSLFYWAFKDPDADRDVAKDRFRAEQDFRALRRSSKL